MLDNNYYLKEISNKLGRIHYKLGRIHFFLFMGFNTMVMIINYDKPVEYHIVSTLILLGGYIISLFL